jgi:YD repeat-containing protein
MRVSSTIGHLVTAIPASKTEVRHLRHSLQSSLTTDHLTTDHWPLTILYPNLDDERWQAFSLTTKPFFKKTGIGRKVAILLRTGARRVRPELRRTIVLIARANTPGVYQDLVTRNGGGSHGCPVCSYDALGNVLSSTDARGFTTVFDRNELGEIYRVTSPAPYYYKVETC